MKNTLTRLVMFLAALALVWSPVAVLVLFAPRNIAVNIFAAVGAFAYLVLSLIVVSACWVSGEISERERIRQLGRGVSRE